VPFHVDPEEQLDVTVREASSCPLL
jgi:hypothetical protein